MFPFDGSSTSWRASRACSSNGTCVEVARLGPGSVGARDGKKGDSSPVLAFSMQEWSMFVEDLRVGRFDLA